MVDQIEIPSFREVWGNLITKAWRGEFDIIGHDCNCMKLMGAGLARQIAVQMGEAYVADQKDERTYWQRLGCFTQAEVPLDEEGNTVLVLNIYSQLEPGRNLDTTALRLSLRKINTIFEGKSIGLPEIGCGIAGGDFDEVREIIREELKDMFVTIVHFKN